MLEEQPGGKCGQSVGNARVQEVARAVVVEGTGQDLYGFSSHSK